MDQRMNKAVRDPGSSTVKPVASKPARKQYSQIQISSGTRANDPVIDITLSSDESVIEISSDEDAENKMDIEESVATLSYRFRTEIEEIMGEANYSKESHQRRLYDVLGPTGSSSDLHTSTKLGTTAATSMRTSTDYPTGRYPSSKKTTGPSSYSQIGNSKTKKEQLKEEAARKRELKRLEKEEKKEAMARDKLLKKSVEEVRRNAKPGEVHKFMTVILDDNLAAKYELTQMIEAAGIQCETTTTPLVENSFGFKRELLYQEMGNDLQLHKVSRWETEDQLMILLEPEDIVPKIYFQLHGASPDAEFDEITLNAYTKSLQDATSFKITLLLHGMDNYFKKLKKNTQQEFRDRVLNGDKEKKGRKRKAQLPVISSLEFHSVLIELQLETNVNYRHVKNVNEIGHMLIQYTKAIAEAPFKRQRKEQGFDWYASADSAGSVKVDSKDGKGLKSLWIEQIQLFNNVGVDTAQAIVNAYPSPKDLIESYSQCQNFEQGQNLLRDIKVRMGIGPLAKTRKVGPELSKKMYRFFTSTSADRCLGSTQDF